MTHHSTQESRDAEERIRAFRRSRNTDDLWPDLSATSRRAALGLIRSIVEAKLAGSERLPGLRAESELEARSIGVAAFAAGMGPLLGHWVAAGLLDASPSVRALLAEHLEHGTRRVALLREHAVGVVRAMRAEGLDPILLKGLHTGAEFFPHPSTRPASDIDILVRPTEIPKAAAAMARSGYVEAVRNAFALRSKWVHPSASRVPHSIEIDVLDNPWTVDLYEALERWYFRGARRQLGSGAFDSTRTIEIDGEPIRVLEQPYLAAFLALHLSIHFRTVQLVRLLELVWVMRGDSRSGRLDASEFETLLRRTDTGRFVYPALALAEDLAPGTVEAPLLTRLAKEVSPRMMRVLDKIRRQEMGALNSHSPDVLFAWAVGPKELLMNAMELVLPSEDTISDLPAIFMRRFRFIVHRWRARLSKVTDRRGGRAEGRGDT
jgi:hypothetical protein